MPGSAALGQSGGQPPAENSVPTPSGGGASASVAAEVVASGKQSESTAPVQSSAGSGANRAELLKEALSRAIGEIEQQGHLYLSRM